MPTFGEIIRNRRKELDLTQAELAAKLGYRSSTTISRIEDGSRDVPQRQVLRIARALEMDPADLITLQREAASFTIIFDDGTEVLVEAGTKGTADSLQRIMSYYKALTEDQRKSIEDQMQYMNWKNAQEGDANGKD